VKGEQSRTSKCRIAHPQRARNNGTKEQKGYIEFVYRDTDRLTGAMTDRVAKTCAMIREMTGHPEGSRG